MRDSKRTRIHRRPGRVSALLVLLLMATVAFGTACGGGEDPTEEPAATNTPAPDATATEEPEPTDTPEPTTEPATATPLPADAAPQPRNEPGTLTLVIPLVGKGSGTNGTQAGLWRWGVTEGPFMMETGKEVTGMVVDEWEIADDLSQITMNVRDGIQFHDGWGELTAEDVAWNINDTNGATNPESIHVAAGDYAAMIGENEAVAVDSDTVRFDVRNFDVRWNANQFNVAAQTAQMFSKDACDENGMEWCQRNIIGTGPFTVEEFRDNERVILQARDEHWRRVPQFDRFVIQEVPEENTRKAMLQTGEADLGEVEIRTQSELRAEGFRIAWTNGSRGAAINFGGNYWETENALEETPLEPWTTGPYDSDLPWVGAPSDWDVPYEDTNNPEGMDDMEQARLVRWALSKAVDRQALNEELFDGLARPFYIGMFMPTDPNWDDKWSVEYDPEEAEEMLDEAGYPRGDDGIRFEVRVTTRQSETQFVEIANALVGFWDDIGVRSTVNTVNYSVFRPTLVDRSNELIYVAGCRHNNPLPWDWPRGLENTSFTRGGFNCAKEIPRVKETFVAAQNEPDMQARIELNNELADWYHDQMLEAGTILRPANITFNPRSVEDWPMPGTISPLWQAPERIIPADR